MSDGEQMSLEEAAFEFAAAFADLEETVEHDRGRSPEEILHQVKAAYDIEEASHVLKREGVTRDDGFDPFSIRVKDREYPDWKCLNCGNRPRLKFDEEPPFECDYCGSIEWLDETPDSSTTEADQ